MRIRKLLGVSAATVAVAAAATAASAGAFPGIGGLLPATAPAASVPAGDPAAAQAEFFSKFTAARAEMNAAQLELVLAFDMKDQVTALQTEQALLQSGALDKDAYKKSKELSDGVSQALQQKMESGAVLSAEGKTHYVASLPHLLKGTLLTVQLPKEAEGFLTTAKAAASSASIADKLKLGGMAMTAGLVAKDMPGFVTTSVSTYKKTLTYGQANKIPLPKDATDALGSV